jgi:hypothetical protein
MSILNELRYPTRWYAKLVTIILALVFFAVLATHEFGNQHGEFSGSAG